METGHFYEYDFLYPMILDLVEKMFREQGIEICLKAGTDKHYNPYPTSEPARTLFYEEMKKIAPLIRAKTKEIQDDGIRIGREATQNSVKAALGIKFGSQEN